MVRLFVETYNQERLHHWLKYKTPDEVHRAFLAAFFFLVLGPIAAHWIRPNRTYLGGPDMNPTEPCSFATRTDPYYLLSAGLSATICMARFLKRRRASVLSRVAKEVKLPYDVLARFPRGT